MINIDIINFIPYGIENAISQEDLAIIMNCNKRTIRQAVFNARAKGAVICSTCEGATGGYYFPLSADEAMPYIKMQQSRIKSTAIALKPALNFIRKRKKGVGK